MEISINLPLDVSYPEIFNTSIVWIKKGSISYLLLLLFSSSI